MSHLFSMMKNVEGGRRACGRLRSPCVYLTWLIASCIFHDWFCTDQEDVDEVDVSSVPEEVLRNIEADTYWCMSKLLDGIQVSRRLGRLGRLRSQNVGRPLAVIHSLTSELKLST